MNSISYSWGIFIFYGTICIGTISQQNDIYRDARLEYDTYRIGITRNKLLLLPLLIAYPVFHFGILQMFLSFLSPYGLPARHP